MKKIIYLVLFTATLFSCQKEMNDPVNQMEQRFFGDICVNPVDYEGSAYETTPGPLKADMPAIFKVKVYNNGVAVPGSPFKNIEGEGAGNPLSVIYEDNPGLTGEVFTFEIWVWVKATTGYAYQLYQTFSVTDDQMINAGTDGIVDFAIGTCFPDSQYQWTWLDPPSSTFNLNIIP